MSILETHWTVPIKWVNCRVCELYLNRAYMYVCVGGGRWGGREGEGDGEGEMQNHPWKHTGYWARWHSISYTETQGIQILESIKWFYCLEHFGDRRHHGSELCIRQRTHKGPQPGCDILPEWRISLSSHSTLQGLPFLESLLFSTKARYWFLK